MTGPTRPPYDYKTKPLGRQGEIIEHTWHEPKWAFLCRPGTGKTKLGLDTAGMLYSAGRIDTLIVVAPNNVEEQWWNAGIPTHLPGYVRPIGGVYKSRMTPRQYERLFAKYRTSDIGLRVLCISYEALQTKRGAEIAMGLAKSRRCLLIVDESHRAAKHTSATHKAVLKLANLCRYKRIATGTLVTQNPFAAWGQFEILGPGLLGYSTLAAFKSMYAEMRPSDDRLVQRIARQFRENTGRSITPQVVAQDDNGRPIYRNLNHLRKRLELYASFLTLRDVSGTEPTVLLSTRYVELSTEQRRAYDDLETLGVAEINGGQLTSADGLSLATRLAQITGGFAPHDEDSVARPIGDANPKIAELLDVVEELAVEKVIIWCRFKAELLAVSAALAEVYGPDAVTQYHGDIGAGERRTGLERFKTDPTARFFVAQVKAGGTGLDGLQTVSSYMVFFSNEYPYLLREQAIARQARTGGNNVVNVIDIVALDTVDIDVVECMRTAEDVHSTVLHRGMIARRTPDLKEAGV